ncbi:putative L-type lectin-domain containing receptor kinase S.7 [Bidens hawaiensis]|uniref:putative L-type lectin-domain containing receptor kinase S.7 n=1 Tax=Bidens hawaiensis TaxID=980011 RepID=UPI004049F081
MSFEVIDAYRLLGIEFYDNVCKVSGFRVSSVMKSDSVLKDGVMLTSWIDYHAVLKRLEVRVAKLGDRKPVEPMVSVRVDLGEILKGEEVMWGMVGFNEKDERVTFVYSWSLEVKDGPKWVHSIPVNPEESSNMKHVKERSGFGSGFMFTIGCGVLAALVMFFVWSYVVDRRVVRGEGEGSGSAVDFKYEKIDVVEVKNSESAMK